MEFFGGRVIIGESEKTKEDAISVKDKDKDGMGFVYRGASAWVEIDDIPQDESIQELYLKAYDNFGVVAKVIDGTTEQAIQNFFFRGLNKDKLEEIRKRLNLDRHFFRICKTVIKHGNCWVEVVGKKENPSKLKLLPPEQMVVVRKPTGGILAHVQVTATKNLIWGKVDSRMSIFKSRENKVISDKSRIIHYTFNRQAGEKYGHSIIRPALPSLMIRDLIQKDVPTIVQRYLAPIIHAKVGTEESPADADQVADVGNSLRDIYSDTEYATDHRVDIGVIGFKDKGVLDVKGLLQMIDEDIMIAMGMYPVLVGKSQAGDTKASEVQLRSESRHIKAIQRELKTEFEDKFIIGLGIGGNEDELVWELVDERETVEHIDNVIKIFGAGLMSAKKANSLLSREFHEESIPDGGFKIIGSDSQATGSDSPLAKRRIDNPTDPHQSTQMVKGQRVKRDDHRNPLDKKTKDTGKSKHEKK